MIGPVVLPVAHATVIGFASFHAAALTAFHAAGFAKAASAAGAALIQVHGVGLAGLAAGQAMEQSLLGGAATGAITASPKALVEKLRRPEQPASAQAVGRILQVEMDRLVQAWQQCSSHNPLDAVSRVKERLDERGPIITWALDLWLRDSLRRVPFYDAAAQRVPNIWPSVRALEIELTSQIKFGLTTAPWRVLRLAYSTMMVVIYAVLAQHVPGVATLSLRLQARWPRLVEHLAATLEHNLATDPSRVLVSSRARRIGAKWRALFPVSPWAPSQGKRSPTRRRWRSAASAPARAFDGLFPVGI